MKGIVLFLLVLMLGMSVYNWYEIRSLRQEIARLETKVNDNQSGGLADQAVQKALVLMMQAREAISNTDWDKARNAYESARQQLSAAASTANEKAGPVLRSLQEQARSLGNEIQKRVPGNR